jgi:hypothetical protein
MLHTDAAGPYKVVAKDMRGHESVDHAVGEYVRNGVTTNTAEGY